MDRTRLGRLLSAALVPLGVALLALSAIIDDIVGTALGAGTALLGAAFFVAVDRFSDVEFDLTETPSVVANVVQLGGVLIVFALLAYLLSDVESVTRVFDAGLPSPTYPAYAGIAMGVLLGGVVPFLTQQLEDRRTRLSDSVRIRTVGFSFTFGTYAILLLYQPSSSALYATAYLCSRICVLVGVYASSRL